MNSQVTEIARRIAGRLSTGVMQAARGVRTTRSGRRPGGPEVTEKLDRTGILVDHCLRLPIGWKDEHVIFPLYEESLAHSLWRAQEFTLIMRHLHLLEHPVLDFGCGDGSFAAVLFGQQMIDFGVDIDEDALAIAKQFGIYQGLIKTDGLSIELPDESVGSVFSNSVLEHVIDLDAVLAELRRVLKVDGLLVFSVPVAQFARDLARYFGKRESVRVNTDYVHRNLLEVEAWRSLLTKHGFSLVTTQEYQPAWFSYYYMMLRFLGNQGLGRIIPNIRRAVWKRYSGRLVELVRVSTSISSVPGGNVFIVAKKHETNTSRS